MSIILVEISAEFPFLNYGDIKREFRSPNFREYRHLLTFIFAINDINNDPAILPNITLGYHLYDSCENVNKVIKDVLQIMSGHSVTAPNYSCMDHGNVAGYIGDQGSATSLPMAQLLGMYGYTQVSYGARDSILSDRRLYPHFFRTVQDNEMQFVALVKLLMYFNWNFVIIFATNDDIGERELRGLSSELTKSGICIEKIFFLTQIEILHSSVINKLKSEVILLCGTSSGLVQSHLARLAHITKNKTFIFTTSWSQNAVSLYAHWINCSLIFSPFKYRVNGLQEMVLSFHPSTHPHDPILEDLWITSFHCVSRNVFKNYIFNHTISITLHNCTGEEHFTNRSNYFEDGVPYRVYTAVQMMAQALDDMYKTLRMSGISKEETEFNVYRRKLKHFMKLLCINDSKTEKVCFNDKGEIPEMLEILHFITKLRHNTTGSDTIVGLTAIVGKFDGSHPPDEQLNISSLHITWLNNKMPYSRCSEECFPGSRIAVTKGHHICCYDCILCSSGEVSNKSDAENCEKCLYTEWPNEARDKCVPKVIEFLSYDTDVVTYVFLFFLVLSSTTIVLIIGIFTFFWNTSVVRANNRNLSFIILVSLKLSLLCILLFIGKPVDTTCMLRHICFGIIFTVVLSSVLAKTIMVCIAFKATTPSSSWRKWIGVKLPNSIVIILSSLQVLNGIVWLSLSPPFQEIDMDSTPGKIIIQCNVGSRLAFYFMLGYMGFLAVMSLILAFMVRKLPDIYNEAKYITFSMLVFCSVWICAIPAYLSSKGKNIVSVEVFAILASGLKLSHILNLPAFIEASVDNTHLERKMMYADIKDEFYTLYVYTYIIQYQLIGDSYVQLLRTVQIRAPLLNLSTEKVLCNYILDPDGVNTGKWYLKGCTEIQPFIHDGQQIPARPFQPNFNVDLAIREYMAFVHILGKQKSDSALAIDREGFMDSFTLFAFDLSPDQEVVTISRLLKQVTCVLKCGLR
ncbi:vomeronasal type-2 receptor 26-like [Anomaloglossus baeobatrachus]|uniref:vomeronasal type-2 receptor 26-like n=1 Tax=Anomaloglossus baeobatrachus TaxID=238106 RepID=UPI003F4FF49F